MVAARWKGYGLPACWFQGRRPCGGFLGWQLYGVSDGTALMRIDESGIPLSAYLGVMGMPGATAYVGLMDIGQPKPGETVVVSAASGAVGSVVGQIAKIKGCRAVGIAGGPDKCTYVVKELGFDACIDYKQGGWPKIWPGPCPRASMSTSRMSAARSSTTVLGRMNPFGRIPCAA